jgi:hypothetical protein
MQPPPFFVAACCVSFVSGFAEISLTSLRLLFPAQTLRWFAPGALFPHAAYPSFPASPKSLSLRCGSSSPRKRSAGLRREPFFPHAAYPSFPASPKSLSLRMKPHAFRSSQNTAALQQNPLPAARPVSRYFKKSSTTPSMPAFSVHRSNRRALPFSAASRRGAVTPETCCS